MPPPATTAPSHSSAFGPTTSAPASRPSRRAKRGEFGRRIALIGACIFLLLWLATWLHDDSDASFRESGHVVTQSDDGDGDVTVASTTPHSPPRFVLYRMIGNDIPPLQCAGQLYENALYALQHEPRRLAGCRRVWVVNNVVNETAERRVVRALKAHGYGDEDIIVRRVNYTHVAQLPHDQWGAAVSAQNEARNAMLEHGRAAGVRWILPWDGNQFVTREAWHRIVAAADRYEAQGITVFKVAMVKVQSLQQPAWLNASSLFRHIRPHAPGQWESQVAFRNDSSHHFKQGVAYGEANKLEALIRICGSGCYWHWPELLKALHLLQQPPSWAPCREFFADTGECGCQAVIGRDYHERKVSVRTALQCGYSVRLWYHPCPGVDIEWAFRSTAYRTELRVQGRELFQEQIRAAMARQGVVPAMGKADGGEL
ncbi:hypothetical protein CLOP_g20793 [Closterium sp. NIES-67]|nr:hypothetical protein CLOP_g20793 [Closterium sp. NIES-67]